MGIHEMYQRCLYVGITVDSVLDEWYRLVEEIDDAVCEMPARTQDQRQTKVLAHIKGMMAAENQMKQYIHDQGKVRGLLKLQTGA